MVEDEVPTFTVLDLDSGKAAKVQVYGDHIQVSSLNDFPKLELYDVYRYVLIYIFQAQTLEQMEGEEQRGDP